MIARINIRLLIRVNLPSLCIVPQNPVPAAITIMVICIMNEIVKLPVIMYHRVPSGGDTMYVSNESATNTPYTASWRFCTIRSGGRNFVLGTRGPPSKLSINVGISTVGMASFGISEPDPA